MKNILIIILGLLFSIKTNAQVTVVLPLDAYEYPNGAYLKDLNESLLPYVGTWKGVLNNHEYTFVFQKFTQHLTTLPNGNYHYEDEIKAKFKVVDLLEEDVIYDNLSATNYDDFLIYGLFPSTSHGIFQFIFRDTDLNCNNTLSFTLMNIIGQTNKLKYCYFEYKDSWKSWDCPNYPNRMNIPVYLPLNDLVLTKQ